MPRIESRFIVSTNVATTNLLAICRSVLLMSFFVAMFVFVWSITVLKIEIYLRHVSIVAVVVIDSN